MGATPALHTNSRRDINTWNTRAGHYGHVHVPGNDHTDHGILPDITRYKTATAAVTTTKDWFDMATKEELRAVVREEITNNLRHAKFRAHGDKKDTTLEGLLAWNLFRIREEQGVMKRLITGVRSAVDRLVPATDKEA